MSTVPVDAAPVISVLVSDVSRMRCELLSTQLARHSQPRFLVIGYAVAVGEFLGLAACSPDIAVVSASLRDGCLSGFEVLEKIRVRHPNTRAIVLLDSCERDVVLAAFRGGARGVFCRSRSLDEFVKCIAAVHGGQIWAGNTEMEFMLDALTALAPLRVPTLEGILNRREERIAALVAAGSNNREIGRKLNLTEQAVSESLSRMFRKAGIHGRVELTMLIRQQRQLSQSDPSHN